MTTNKATSYLRQGAPLMLTLTSQGALFSIDGRGAVPTKFAREITRETDGPMQGDLFMRPNEDGLFPGCSQTWQAN
jgi:hypothetical protein